MLNRIRAFLLSVLMLFTLCACGNAVDETPYESLMAELEASSTPAPEQDRALTVATNKYSPFFAAHARAYMDTHPGVTIEIKEYQEQVIGENSEIAVQVMAGSGPDIVASLISRNFLESGRLLDLYPLMENDPEFREEDYFMNVVSAMETGGRLYAFPYDYQFPGLFAMRKDVDPEAAHEFETAERVTYEDMLSWFERAGSPSGVIYEGFGPHDALLYCYDSAIDLRDKSCNFPDSPLGAMLERAKALPAPHSTYTSDGMNIETDLKQGTDMFTDLTNQDYRYLFWANPVLNSEPQVLFPYEGSIFTKPRLISSAGGKTLFDVGNVLAITDSCEDPELAWDFIRFCVADKTEPYDWFNYNTASTNWYYSVGSLAAVNRSTYAAQCAFYADAQYELGIEAAGMTPIGEKEQVIADAAAFLTALPDQLELSISPYTVVNDIIWPDLYLYFSDQQSIDVTLENIQSKVSLYLNE